MPSRKLRMIYFRIAIPLFAAMMIATAISLPRFVPKPVYTEVDLRTLGMFPLDPVSGSISDVPPRFLGLDGKKVHMTGLMFASDAAQSSVSRFQFVYNMPRNSSHGPPHVQERVFATAATSVLLIHDIADLYGTLHVKVKRDETGEIVSLYQLDVDSVQVFGTPIAGQVTSPLPEIAPDLFRIGVAVLLVYGLYELLLFIRRVPSKTMVHHNICPVCGYDTRASPQRCPECGTPTGRMPVSAGPNPPQSRKEI